MALPSIRVLDLDQSLAREDFADANWFVWRDMAASLRYMTTWQHRKEFEDRLRGVPDAAITFYGSGDYHHLTFSLLKRQREPFSLLVFDQHPDWDVTSPWPCCGCWVNEALQLPLVERVIVIGAGRTDLHGWHLLRGNTRALRQKKLEIYPYSWVKSKIFGSSRRLACADLKKQGLATQVRWKTVAEHGLEAILQDVIQRLPNPRLYVSIDKDVLLAEFATTNWEPGEMSLDELCNALEQVRRLTEVVGVDITGEWSAGMPNQPFFAHLAKADHPTIPRPSPLQLASNAATNRALLQALRPLH